jgi:hypothetical protein
MSLLLSDFYPRAEAVLTTGNQTISGVKNFVVRPTVNRTGVLLSGELSPGIYNYELSGSESDSYIKQSISINNNLITDIKNKDIVNFYFGTNDNSLAFSKSRTLKVNPGVLIDVENARENSRNLIKFNNNTPYSGKAIRKIRYNSTIGNGYEKINLTNLSNNILNSPIIKPKARRLETFYDINVPSGGGTRYLVFNTPNSFPFVQGLSMNLRFNFEADNNPCIISGVAFGASPSHVFILSGAQYNFIQKERVILISKGENGTTYEFKHW